MNAPSQLAVCLHGDGFDACVQEWLTQHRDLEVFGHFVADQASTDKLSFSKAMSMSTRGHRLSDVARAGPDAANWSTLRHADVSLSICRAIANKRTHELTNNMRFDVVICLDACRINELHRIISHCQHVNPGVIMAASQRRPYHNNLWEMDTSFMMGTSRDMDTLSRFHHSYITGEFWQIFSSGEHDPSDRMASLGMLMWKWAHLRNLRIDDIQAHSVNQR